MIRNRRRDPGEARRRERVRPLNLFHPAAAPHRVLGARRRPGAAALQIRREQPRERVALPVENRNLNRPRTKPLQRLLVLGAALLLVVVAAAVANDRRVLGACVGAAGRRRRRRAQPQPRPPASSFPPPPRCARPSSPHPLPRRAEPPRGASRSLPAACAVAPRPSPRTAPRAGARPRARRNRSPSPENLASC